MGLQVVFSKSEFVSGFGLADKKWGYIRCFYTKSGLAIAQEGVNIF